MSPNDIIEIPGYPGWYNRRVAVERWQRAGSPALTDAGRTKSEQQMMYDLWQSGEGYPADNPNSTWQPLAHCRFVAFDIKYSRDRQAMINAGFRFPYDYEWWHAEEYNVYQYEISDNVPEPVTPKIKKRNPDMPIFCEPNVIIWPNGYANSYDRNVYLACQWAANGELNYLNDGGWAVEILVSENWHAVRKLDEIQDSNNPPPVSLTADEIAQRVKEVLESTHFSNQQIGK